MGGKFGNLGGIKLPENAEVIDVIGFQRGVCFELAPPIAFGSLDAKEHPDAAIQSVIEPLVERPARRNSRTIYSCLQAEFSFRQD